MKVKFKDGFPAPFDFEEEDKITIVVREDLVYRGFLTEIEEDGFWAVLDDDPDREEFFHFGEVENVRKSEHKSVILKKWLNELEYEMKNDPDPNEVDGVDNLPF